MLKIIGIQNSTEFIVNKGKTQKSVRVEMGEMDRWVMGCFRIILKWHHTKRAGGGLLETQVHKASNQIK